MSKRFFRFKNDICIAGLGSVAGKTEGKAHYSRWFDEIIDDEYCGKKTFEEAELEIALRAAHFALRDSKAVPTDIDAYFAGDLLNQIITADFAAVALGLPFVGIYGACSNMSLSMLLAAVFIDSGHIVSGLCATSSHFGTAERQYRVPLEQGATPAPSSQHTVTGSGAAIVCKGNFGPKIVSATLGKAIDFGQSDPVNMGAAMAPAAADTIITHLRESGSYSGDFDLIITGDLGRFGSEMLYELTESEGVHIRQNHIDCGVEVFSGLPNMHCGGSGCGCCAIMMCGYFLKRLREGSLSRILFAATGALFSPVTSMQKRTIPAIAHAVEIMNDNVY